ncbi:MAG TPA: SRPBCC family protein [Egibacteraceae bacterium]|jgi:uncharacterized protein YndB with AHSA1/START domain|nr:SRPBCC family protein [Egibacteraceae bacterium]
MDFSLTTDTVIPAPPEAVFDVITDIDRLPDWNLEIPKVVESPVDLAVGAEWVVTIRAMKTRWNSRSRVLELDRDRGRFAYRSQSDDGNPSFADWRWQLEPDPGGTRVIVEVSVNPRTFLRRRVLSELRRSGLRKAIEQSLEALSQQVAVG